MNKEQELPKRTPEHIIGSGLLAQLIAAGYQVVPARRSSDEQAEVVAPVAFLSAGQFETLGPDPDDGGGAAYLPIRHTAAGNFQMALYASPPAVAAGGVTDALKQARKFIADDFGDASDAHDILAVIDAALAADEGIREWQIKLIAEPDSGEAVNIYHATSPSGKIHTVFAASEAEALAIVKRPTPPSRGEGE